jgi:hypothetical protein
MRQQTSELFDWFDKAIKGPILRMSLWLPSLLARFLMNGGLSLLFSICLDIKDADSFKMRRRSICSAAWNARARLRAAALRATFTFLLAVPMCLYRSGHVFAQTARARITTDVDTRDTALRPSDSSTCNGILAHTSAQGQIVVAASGDSGPLAPSRLPS